LAHLILTRGRSYRHGKFMPGLDLRLQIGKITMSLMVILILVAVSFSYLSISNKQVTQGYKINELKIQKNKLMLEGDKIVTQVDEATAIVNIEKQAIAQGMRQPSYLTYLDSDKSVAKK